MKINEALVELLEIAIWLNKIMLEPDNRLNKDEAIKDLLDRLVDLISRIQVQFLKKDDHFDDI